MSVGITFGAWDAMLVGVRHLDTNCAHLVDGTSTEEPLPSDWPIDTSVQPCLGFRLTYKSQTHCGQVSLGGIRKVGEGEPGSKQAREQSFFMVSPEIFAEMVVKL